MARTGRKTAEKATTSATERARSEDGATGATTGQKKQQPKGRKQAATRKRVRVSEGIYRDRYGLAATVKVNGIQRERRFPPGTRLRTIKGWRDETRGMSTVTEN